MEERAEPQEPGQQEQERGGSGDGPRFRVQEVVHHREINVAAIIDAGCQRGVPAGDPDAGNLLASIAAPPTPVGMKKVASIRLLPIGVKSRGELNVVKIVP